MIKVAHPFYATHKIKDVFYVAAADSTGPDGNVVKNIIRYDKEAHKYVASPTTGSIDGAVEHTPDLNTWICIRIIRIRAEGRRRGIPSPRVLERVGPWRFSKLHELRIVARI